MTAPGEPWEAIDRYLSGEATLDELVDAIDATSALEKCVGRADAARLRALRHPPGDVGDVARWAASVARDVYERGRPARLASDRAGRIARGISDGSINAAAGARALARLRAEGHDWIPDAFEGLAAALDAAPSAEAATFGARLAGARARAVALRPAIVVAARRLLELLDRRVVV